MTLFRLNIRSLGGVMVCVMMCCSGVVAAQSNAPSRLHRYAEPGKDDGNAVMKEYVRCFAARGFAKELLSTLPSSAEEAELAEEMNGRTDNCLSNMKVRMDNRSLQFSTVTLRGEVARTLLRYNYRKQLSDPNEGAAMASLVQRVEADEGYDRSTIVLHQFAACLVDEHFEESIAFALSDSGSDEESQGLAELSPYFSDCFADGATMSLDRPVLKLTLAEAAYQNIAFESEGSD